VISIAQSMNLIISSSGDLGELEEVCAKIVEQNKEVVVKIKAGD